MSEDNALDSTSLLALSLNKDDMMCASSSVYGSDLYSSQDSDTSDAWTFDNFKEIYDSLKSDQDITNIRNEFRTKRR